MIKKRYCGPCTEVYPKFRKLHQVYEGNKLFTFATLTVSENDYEFILKDLDIRSVPSFQVYLHNEKLFSSSGKIGLQSMTDFLSKLP